MESAYAGWRRGKESLGRFPPRPDQAVGHFKDAWDDKPDVAAIRDVGETAATVGAYADNAQVLADAYRHDIDAVMDNFAEDEIVSTVTVMAFALAVAFVLARAVGFWTRRGRPGLVTRTLQRWGARRFRPWYVRNLPYAVGPALHSAARERLQRDIVANPRDALDPEVHRALELYFTGRNTT